MGWEAVERDILKKKMECDLVNERTMESKFTLINDFELGNLQNNNNNN